MRRLLWRIHKWSGLVVAATLLLQAATGLLLVARWDAARLLDPKAMRGGDTAVSLDRVDEAARAALPNFTPVRILYPDARGGIYLVRAAAADGAVRYAAVDPATGAVLRAGPITSFPSELALYLHNSLLAGRAGAALVALQGVTLTLLLVTGLLLWWPGRGRVLRALRIRLRAPSQAVLLSLHKTTGTVAALLLLIVAFSGTLLAVEAAAAPPVLPQPFLPFVAVDRAVRAAQALLPANPIKEVRRTGPASLLVVLHARDRGARDVHLVTVRLPDGEPRLTTADDLVTPALVALSLHTGEVLGRVGKVLDAAMGLVLLTSIGTGLVIWWQRRQARRRTRLRSNLVVVQ
jgi:uncharacterized iron-regulated membrane protein